MEYDSEVKGAVFDFKEMNMQALSSELEVLTQQSLNGRVGRG